MKKLLPVLGIILLLLISCKEKVKPGVLVCGRSHRPHILVKDATLPRRVSLQIPR